jgi:hypothetical protein
MTLVEGNKLIADFMEVKNVFEYDFGDNIKALYISSKEDGDIDYKSGIDWLDYTDWNKLMPVIDKIENTDMSGWHYKWTDSDGERNNFNGFEFDMRPLSDGYAACVFMELALDPVERVAGDPNKTYPTRMEAVWNTVVEFIQYYNEFMKNVEQISLFDFLHRPAGSELGMAVYAEFKNKYPEEKVGSRYVSNTKYTGNIDLYPRWFLEQYFAK